MASTRFERYGIYRVDLNPTQGSEMAKVRPAVIVSLNELNAALDTVVVCPLTTKLRPSWRCRMPVRCQGRTADVAVDHIRSISKSRIRSQMGTLRPNEARELRRLISEMYGAA